MNSLWYSQIGKNLDRVDDAQHAFDLLWEGRSKFAIITPISETHINALKRIAPRRSPVRPPNADAHIYWTSCKRSRAPRPRYFGRHYTCFALASSADVLPKARVIMTITL